MDHPLSGDRPAVKGAPGLGEPDPKRLTILEQALWKSLSEGTPLGPYCEAWLTLQCRMIPGTRRAAVLLGRPGDPSLASPVASWPDGEEPTSDLASVADMAMAQRRGVFWGEGRGDGEGRSALLAYPLVIDGDPRGVVALEVEGGGRPLRGAMRQLQWGAFALRDRLRKERDDGDRRIVEQTKLALEIVAVALEEEGFSAACRAVVTELALRLDCERVSVGFVRRGHAFVAAISHSAEFGKQMNLVRRLAGAMDEALDQRAIVLFPDSPDDAGDAPSATRAHAELARVHGAGTILTLPLFVRDRYVGALVCERAADRPFDQAAVDLVDGVAGALGPILGEKRHNDRWVVVKVWEALAAQARRLLGPGYLGRKLGVMAALLVVLVFWFAEGPYRVTADAVAEGIVQRELVAAFDGFVRDAPVRAGDTVAEGDLVVALDDRDLALERLRLVTEQQKLLHEYQRALGERNRAETNIIRSQIDQAEAQIRLIDAQLARAKVFAPFAGLVVSGDLTQAIGAAVRRGDVLFKLAPLAGYRVVLNVDESQIADVAVGQEGTLLVVSLPDEPFRFIVDKITPVAVSKEGRNTFEVEARLVGVPPRLRPGMEGVGKIDVAERRLIWIWTRTLVDWLRLFTWRWVG
jgi:multidrug resistance efflux pump